MSELEEDLADTIKAHSIQEVEVRRRLLVCGCLLIISCRSCY